MPRRFQFSLRVVLAVVTGACVWLGLVTNRAHRQRDAVREIESLGGVVYYNYHNALRTARAIPAGAVRYDRNLKPPPRGRLQTLIGDEFFYKVEFVDLSHSAASEAQIVEFHAALPHATIKTPPPARRNGPTTPIIHPFGGGGDDPVLLAITIVAFSFFAWIAALCVRRVWRKEMIENG